MQSWAQNQQFNYEVWTDNDKVLALYYGAADSSYTLFPKRITVLLDESGELLLEYVEHVDAGAHPAQVLDDAKSLFGK